ncbi:hypothetical protein EIN_247130 [Entamoeba invadens IP1]|uniref:SPRY domain-containing protein n=1 Tax=Entamoeba invadens IP1 TaxID=370355 RepID=A0A0A1UGE2_ENTIV|nr:hypothetical protein EIN_247130 [Entamoeba invadens IP1]ELP94819.1 hypothetical protein EIN_247130 [Entamoeba invadens IP1]|eukprot:XP_004261590.1 hypothetical protein EIN_247130 [Entamoeba invadens IP1]
MSSNSNTLEIHNLKQVLLYFITSEEIRLFLMVNHKCQETVVITKTNPLLKDISSLFWFFKYFSPETFDNNFSEIDSIDFFTKTKTIQNVDFSSVKNVLFDQNFATVVFPKILRLRLSKTTKQKTDFIIKNAHLFTSLKSLRGDLKSLVNFLKVFTQNENAGVNPLPKIIVVETIDYTSKKHPWEILLQKLVIYLPKTQNISVHVILPKNETKIKDFPKNLKVTFWQQNVTQKNSEIFEKHFLCESGKINVIGTIDGNDINDVIKKAYPKTIVYSNNEVTGKNTWDVPDCVKKFEMEDCMFLQPQQLNFNLGRLKELEMQDCCNLIFSHSIENIETLKMTNCDCVTFALSCGMNSLKFFKIENSNKIKVECTLTQIAQLLLFVCTEIKLLHINNNTMNELILINTNSVSLPFCKFLNKSIFIESSQNLCFGKNENPSNRNGVSADLFKEMCSRCYKHPPRRVVKNESQSRFEMSDFFSISEKVSVNGGTITRLSKENGGNFDTIISRLFSGDDKRPFLVYNGQNTKEIENVRYFELHTNVSYNVTVGLFDEEKYNVYDNSQIGELEGSFGYHVPSGIVLKEGHKHFLPNNFTAPPNMECVVGCGFDFLDQKVFFTLNGVLIEEIATEVCYTSAVVSFGYFECVYINYGETPFVFKEFEKLFVNQ